MSFCLFEIARSATVQKKIQAEIDSVLNEKNNFEFTYENLGKLKYLDCTIDETLRKYPVVPAHFRTATQDYELNQSGLFIPKGTKIWIPVLGIHRDPKIYDEPMKFKPERFLNSSNGGGKAEGTFYMPFGDGPRSCLGIRMGKLTTKIGLATILKNYNVTHKDRSLLKSELEFHPNCFVLTPTKQFNIALSAR